jgi:hypothetical protein
MKRAVHLLAALVTSVALSACQPSHRFYLDHTFPVVDSAHIPSTSSPRLLNLSVECKGLLVGKGECRDFQTATGLELLHSGLVAAFISAENVDRLLVTISTREDAARFAGAMVGAATLGLFRGVFIREYHFTAIYIPVARASVTKEYRSLVFQPMPGLLPLTKAPQGTGVDSEEKALLIMFHAWIVRLIQDLLDEGLL